MQVLNIFHVLITVAMIAFILIQKGAGATAGAAFGSGASGTVFGSRGAGNFLSRTTWVLAALFCLISLTMAVMASRMSVSPETDLGVVATAPIVEETSAPVASDFTTSGLPVTDLPTTGSSLPVESAESSDLPQIDANTVQPGTEIDAGDMPMPNSDTHQADETVLSGDGS